MSVIDRDQQGSFARPVVQVGTLDFSDIRTNDYILIFTRNSFYSFLVTDAAHMRGHLAGGAALTDGFEAVLLGAIVKRGHSGFLAERASLQTNSRALFMVAAGSRVRELMTSAITRLVCLKSHPTIAPETGQL